ncbi:MAG: esterase-like activity of phytase family protein [Pseudorhodobacter sp.]
MRKRAGLALIAGAFLLTAFLNGRGGPEGPAAFLGSYPWDEDDPRFGGFSALELNEDGTYFTAISDRGAWIKGRILRDEAGLITAIDADVMEPLKGKDGKVLRGRRGDAEGLAIAPDGSIIVSFENVIRLQRHTALDSPAEILPPHPDFDTMPSNYALEALAIGPDGTFYTLPEDMATSDGSIPVYRFCNGAWGQHLSIPKRGDFKPVGADFGPDGRLYILERAFSPLYAVFGFSNRVRSFLPGKQGLGDERHEMQSALGRFDNHEGLAIWRDEGGAIRLTMISDNNRNALQRTEFVEYRLPPR